MVAIPRPASTVVLMDDDSRVYLTKRPASMKFMGGYHVFPGGSVDEGDHLVNLDDHVKTEIQDDSLQLAFYIAAARELFEEAGILLANHVDGSPAQLSKEQEMTYRQQLQNGEISFHQLLATEKLCFPTHWLTYMGQIITPSISKIRFDTRFFLAKLPQGQTPDPDKNEIDEALWITPEEALDAYQQQKMKLAPPTIITLETIVQYRKGGALMMSVTESELLALLKKQKSNLDLQR